MSKSKSRKVAPLTREQWLNKLASKMAPRFKKFEHETAREDQDLLLLHLKRVKGQVNRSVLVP